MPPPPPKSGFPTWAIVLIATLGTIVLLVVVMGVLAVAGMRSYVSASKTAEATNSVGEISRSAIDAYDRESMSSGLLSAGATTGVTTHQLCGSASHPVPISISAVSARKYQSAMSDWGGSPTDGWECLRFEMVSPQYYQYDYKATGSGKVGDSYTASAKGDLDGDGKTSSFTITGRVSSGDIIIADPTPKVVDANE